MSDLETLQQKVARLAHNTDSFSGGWRDLMKSPGADALAAIMLEVEETQLLRRLVFRNDQGEAIGLHVSSGRLLRLSEPIPPQLLAGQEPVGAQDLSDSDQEQISSVIAILRNFTSQTETLCVKSHILDAKNETPNFGIPAAKLLRVCADATVSSENRSKCIYLIEFAKKCSPFATAVLGVEDGTTSFECGPDEHLQSLRKLAAEETALASEADDGDGRKPPPESCIILSGHPENGHCILCAAVSDSLVFVMFEAAALETVVNFWTSREA